jgi:hypothetical protein
MWVKFGTADPDLYGSRLDSAAGYSGLSFVGKMFPSRTVNHGIEEIYFSITA